MNGTFSNEVNISKFNLSKANLTREAPIYLSYTNVCIVYLKGKSDRVRQRFSKLETNNIAVCSIALAYDLILVTHNAREFGRVEGLKLEDWEDN